MRLNRKLTLLTEINEHKLFHIYPHFIFFLPNEITATFFLPKNKKRGKNQFQNINVTKYIKLIIFFYNIKNESDRE